MTTKNNLLAVVIALLACIVVVWFSTSIRGGEKTYELQPQITIPEYRTDAARAIDAYERLMERYMDLTEMNLIHISADLKVVVKKLDSIDAKLTRLAARMAAIEKTLGLEKHKPQTDKKPHTKETHKKDNCKASPNL